MVHPIPAPSSRPARAVPSLKRKRQKGDRVENRAIRLLKKHGFRIEKRPTRAKFVGGRIIYVPVDWFGLFDWLAVKNGDYRWGQAIVDSGGHAAATRRQLEAQAETFIAREPNDIPRVTMELWRWMPGGTKAGQRIPRGWMVEGYDLAEQRWRLVYPITGDPIPRNGEAVRVRVNRKAMAKAQSEFLDALEEKRRKERPIKLDTTLVRARK